MMIWTNEIEAIIEKIDHNMERFGTKFPHLSHTGIYSEQLTEDGSWTGSFWTGMVYLAYRYTGNQKYIDYLLEYLPVYDWRLREGYKDHDLGFLYQLYAVVLHKATGSDEAKNLAIRAAEELLKRYNTKGDFIRAWGLLESDERSGKIIMDCMMNLPLLNSAYNLTGKLAFKQAAEGHARTTMLHQIRADGSSYHTYDFNPETGEPIGGFNEGGYSDESTWSRGQAWGIYGFALAYRYTGDEQYEAAAARLTEYFVAQLEKDWIPYWDFTIPDRKNAQKDASAAAIAACGILQMVQFVPSGTGRWEEYRAIALSMLDELRAHYSVAKDQQLEASLSRSFGRREGVEYELYAIWGDYYYLEGLMMASGKSVDVWL